MLTPGTLLDHGKFEIIRALGAGGFGMTYLARQVNLGRQVVLKSYLDEELTASAPETEGSAFLPTPGEGSSYVSDKGLSHSAEDLLKEGRHMIDIKHPSVATIFDAFIDEQERRVYLVLEYIAGKTLAEKLAEHPDTATKLQWIEQLADGLAAVHKQGMVHRDVTPGNILIADKDGRAVLIDFGIAVRMEQSSFRRGGTGSYMAPEQQMLNTKLGPQTDVYGLGATFFYAFTGEKPRSAGEAVTQGQKNPKAYAPDLSPWIVDALQACLKTNVQERLPDMAAVKRTFKVAGKPQVDIPPPVLPGREVPPPLTPWYQRPWVLGGGALTLVAVALFGLKLSGVMGGEAPAPPTKPAASEEIKQEVPPTPAEPSVVTSSPEPGPSPASSPVPPPQASSNDPNSASQNPAPFTSKPRPTGTSSTRETSLPTTPPPSFEGIIQGLTRSDLPYATRKAWSEAFIRDYFDSPSTTVFRKKGEIFEQMTIEKLMRTVNTNQGARLQPLAEKKNAEGKITQWTVKLEVR